MIDFTKITIHDLQHLRSETIQACKSKINLHIELPTENKPNTIITFAQLIHKNKKVLVETNVKILDDQHFAYSYLLGMKEGCMLFR